MCQSGKIRKVIGESSRCHQKSDKKCKRFLPALFLWPRAAKVCVALGVAAASAVSAWGFPVEIQGVDTVEGGVTLVYEVDCVTALTDKGRERIRNVMQEYVDDVLNRYIDVHSILPSRSSGFDSRRHIIFLLGDGLAMRQFLTRELDWKEGVAGTVIHEQYEQKNEIGEDGVPRDRMSKNTFVTRKSTAPRLRKIVLIAVTPASEDDGLALRQA